ncbi:MAG: hypothetical protein FWE47_04645 [Oscillospiraceae bacterium]|nr:hypothetical protein [Oscillospiraceae bacterium]
MEEMRFDGCGCMDTCHHEPDCGCKPPMYHSHGYCERECRRIDTKSIIDLIESIKDIKKGLCDLERGEREIFEAMAAIDKACKELRESICFIEKGEKEIDKAMKSVEGGLCELLRGSIY